MAYEQWRQDWDAGFAFGGVVRIGLPLYSYGLGRMDLYGRSILMPGYTPLDVYLVTQPPAEFERQVETEFALLRSWGDFTPDKAFGDRIRQARIPMVAEYMDDQQLKASS